MSFISLDADCSTYLYRRVLTSEVDSLTYGRVSGAEDVANVVGGVYGCKVLQCVDLPDLRPFQYCFVTR